MKQQGLMEEVQVDVDARLAFLQLWGTWNDYQASFV